MTDLTRLRTELESDSDKIFKEYYSRMPLIQLNGGLQYSIRSSIETISKTRRPTAETCKLYFAIEGTVMSYLTKDAQDILELYYEKQESLLGGTFGLEQLLGSEMTQQIIGSFLASAMPSAGTIAASIYSLFKGRLNGKVPDKKLKEHAENISVEIINSQHVNVYINTQPPAEKSQASTKKGNSKKSKNVRKKTHKQT